MATYNRKGGKGEKRKTQKELDILQCTYNEMKNRVSFLKKKNPHNNKTFRRIFSLLVENQTREKKMRNGFCPYKEKIYKLLLV
ncbi:hypothetical protein POVCU2_0030500 [Plasmodium ovale curtisi]|uniref:Uncharacterized protein n=1 Tax=Plasmodium ovale curtisi TaxID=864141 RepID=A0A1A8WPG9_PLAOA|nr:hypothetical protein POVCU2_0030500 [Plasmodium ovale curtisi]SBS94175.1 hypothetical protein POVCU1_027790 [Plasmodium ovale curtisi]